VDYCTANDIHFQASDVMSEVFGKGIAPPRAVGSLHEIAQSLPSKDGRMFTAQQVVLKWLVQSGVSVTSFAWDTAAVHEYSPQSIVSMPDLSRQELEKVESAVSSILRGEDLPPPMARFHNRLKDSFLHLFWLNEATGEEVPVETVSPGKTYVSSTYEGHKFVGYADDDVVTKSQPIRMVVQKGYGQSQRYLIREEL